MIHAEPTRKRDNAYIKESDSTLGRRALPALERPRDGPRRCDHTRILLRALGLVDQPPRPTLFLPTESGNMATAGQEPDSPGARLQRQLQAVVQSVQWTYSVFWQVCPQQGVLLWCDGHYNGTIKTVQPMEVSREEACSQRSQQLLELYHSLSGGETNQPARRPCAALSPEDLTESEWFYLMCISFSFSPGVGSVAGRREVNGSSGISLGEGAGVVSDEHFGTLLDTSLKMVSIPETKGRNSII
ncbi:hypothetical protein EJ110_NYTH13836 [Nymphaea thermarum]|nr:hypothetical protein EJ110_NYTH13836 [Nymphaea thermarum]